MGSVSRIRRPTYILIGFLIGRTKEAIVKTVKANYGFEMIKDSDGVSFSVKGTRLGIMLSSIILGAFIFVGFFAGIIYNNQTSSVILGVLVGVVIASIVIIICNESRSTPQTIRVNVDSVIVNRQNKKYDIDHIGDMRTANLGSNLTQSEGGAIDMLTQQGIHNRSWAIQFRYGASYENAFVMLEEGVAKTLGNSLVEVVSSYQSNKPAH